MFKRKKLIIIALFWAVCTRPPMAAAENSAPPHTLITPHMEVPIVDGENVVFCSTFQIAWNDMKQRVVGEPIRLESSPDIVRYLNKGLSTKADIDETDYFARAGAGSDEFVDGVNRELRERFGRDAPRIGDEYRAGDIILAYAFLKKSMEFPRPFDKFAHPVSFFAGANRSRIQGFGVFGYSEDRHGVFGDQVEVVDYHGPDDFIIRLRSSRPDDEIVLANVPNGETLLETYRKVESRVDNGAPARLSNGDVLMIPMMAATISHSYDMLAGLNLLNEGWEGWFVYEAKQDIEFRMDERGVALDSQAKLALKKGPAENRLIMFDDPYMLYVKSKNGEYPYFVIWVGNAELLIPGDQRS